MVLNMIWDDSVLFVHLNRTGSIFSLLLQTIIYRYIRPGSGPFVAKLF